MNHVPYYVTNLNVRTISSLYRNRFSGRFYFTSELCISRRQTIPDIIQRRRVRRRSTQAAIGQSRRQFIWHRTILVRSLDLIQNLKQARSGPFYSGCTESIMSQGKKSPVLVDYRKNDYRGFLFVVHEEYGLMLLRCTRKKNKPPHWQLPGGHIDEEEFLRAGMYVFV